MKIAYYTYRHCLGKYYTLITKRVMYYGKVRHTYRYDGPQLALVLCEGNKHTSRVPLHQLEFPIDEAVWERTNCAGWLTPGGDPSYKCSNCGYETCIGVESPYKKNCPGCGYYMGDRTWEGVWG